MSDLPIACTLGPAALKARREDLLGGLVRQAQERVDLANGYRIRFGSDDDVLQKIASVVEIERQCCRFLRFQVTVDPGGGPIWLESPARPGRRSFSRACWSRNRACGALGTISEQFDAEY